MPPKIAKLGCIRAEGDAAKPINKRLDPTRAKPPAHVNTGPIDLKILLEHVLETKKLTVASDVNSKPMSLVDIPWFLRKVEKNLVG